MQLTYRGIPYNCPSTQASTAYSHQTATYRGLRYFVPQAQAVASILAKPLKYRGISIGAPETDWHPTFRPANP